MNTNNGILVIVLLTVVCILSVSCTTVKRYTVHVPSLDNTIQHGDVQDSRVVRSSIECILLCNRYEQCEVSFYNTTTKLCTVTDNQALDLSHDGISGIKVYKDKGSCLYFGYQYFSKLNKCINFDMRQRLPWHSAKALCETEGGRLVVIDSQLKDSELTPHLLDIYESTNNRGWWIGLNDLNEEGIFKWVSGQNMNYSNWDLDQPDNANIPGDEIGADCVQYYYRNVEKTFAWFDINCDRKRKGQICENIVTV